MKKSNTIIDITVTDETFSLIGDYEYIYGIGNIQNFESIEKDSLFVVDFKGIQYYSIHEISESQKLKESRVKDSIETYTYKLNESLIVTMLNNIPRLYSIQYSITKLERVLSAVFSKEIIDTDKDKIISIINKAKEQKISNEKRQLIMHCLFFSCYYIFILI